MPKNDTVVISAKQHTKLAVLAGRIKQLEENRKRWMNEIAKIDQELFNLRPRLVAVVLDATQPKPPGESKDP